MMTLMDAMNARGIFWLFEGAVHGTPVQLRPTRSLVFLYHYKEDKIKSRSYTWTETRDTQYRVSVCTPSFLALFEAHFMTSDTCLIIMRLLSRALWRNRQSVNIVKIQCLHIQNSQINKLDLHSVPIFIEYRDRHKLYSVQQVQQLN